MPKVYQYAPLTGPVWREPVSSRLAWLPSCQLRAPDPPRATFSSYVIPFVTAVAVASSLAWLPQGSAQPQSAPRAVQSWSVVSPFPVAPTFDASQFPFAVPTPRPSVLEQRVAAGAVEPFFAALYQPAGLQWLPGGGPQPRGPVPPSPGWLAFSPFPLPPTGYDPALLTWLPRVAGPARAEPQKLQPDWFFAALGLYDPAGLDWLANLAQPAVPLVRVWPSQYVAPFTPVLPVPFDPRNFPWAVISRSLPPERRWPGGVVQPFTAALYRPEGLQWLPGGRQQPRSALPVQRSLLVLDPLPRLKLIIALPIIGVEDRSGPRYLVLDQSGKRYLVLDWSAVRYPARDSSA